MRKLFLLLLLCPHLGIAQSTTIQGTVNNAQGSPVANAVITCNHGNTQVVTGTNGQFKITIAALPDTLTVSHISYVSKTIGLTSIAPLFIILDEAVNQLDATVVIAYGTTTKRLNTGSVTSIAAKEIAKQPISNPLTALSGRLTGVVVTQQSGVPGSSVKMQVRGRGSVAQGTEPLYIIDGVPFAAGNLPLNQNGSILTSELGTGLSPFQSLSPFDIESIEVLKDADATAIYGSRGANGVVLITTKKGRSGKPRLAFNIYRSTSALTRTVQMMQTPQYLQMRRQAFKNDNVTPNNNTAPDLLVWDTTAYTNVQHLLYSGHAAAVNAHMQVSGGDAFTQYLLSGGYRKEGTVIAGDMNSWRANAALNLQHNSAGGRLGFTASVNYTWAKNNLTPADAGGFLSAPPNLPALFDSTGKLNWQQGGINFTNPLYYRYQQYSTGTGNLLGKISLSYKLYKWITLKAAMGYNSLRADESSVFPMAAQNPALNPNGALEIGNSNIQSAIIEPQAEVRTRLWKGRVTALIGGTMQCLSNMGTHIKTSGFTSDNLIHALAAGPVLEYKLNSESQYRYAAVFGRLNYNLFEKYIINVSARNDGSSRFGPGKRFSTFAAVGAAWIFSSERFFKQNLPVISFGKLRASYGTSGNDQIGDYQYMDAWSAAQPYQGTTALYPVNLYNPDYRWELNKKIEAALELGLFKDRLMLNIGWYSNRSGNQLVNYRLPSQTGFSSVTMNLDAVVQNSGIEMEITSKNISTKTFEWSTSFNLTIPKNKLLAFPGLSTSAYANSYVIGQPLNVIYRYSYAGVDTATGVFTFEDANKDGVMNTADYRVAGTTDPSFYGGMQNSFSYKGFQFSVFAEFRKQTGKNYLYSLYNNKTVPGLMYNMPVMAAAHWQKPGDVAEMQRYTATTTSAAYKAVSNFLLSNGIYSDASFIRIKTVSLSYALPATLTKKAGIQQAVVYLNAQNLFTFTRYKGSDPETQNLWQMPPLRTIALGCNLTF